MADSVMIGFKYTSNIFTMFVLQQSDLKCYLLDNLLLLTGTTLSGICFHFHLSPFIPFCSHLFFLIFFACNVYHVTRQSFGICKLYCEKIDCGEEEPR